MDPWVWKQTLIIVVAATLFGGFLVFRANSSDGRDDSVTRSQVRSIVKTQAPWVADKPEVMRALRRLETENRSLKKRLERLEQTHAAVCANPNVVC